MFFDRADYETLMKELNLVDLRKIWAKTAEEGKMVCYTTDRKKGPYTLAPEGTEIEITGKFDPKKLKLLVDEVIPEGAAPDDDLYGIIAVEYDGHAFPVMTDGDSWGTGAWGFFAPGGTCLVSPLVDPDED